MEGLSEGVAEVRREIRGEVCPKIDRLPGEPDGGRGVPRELGRSGEQVEGLSEARNGRRRIREGGGQRERPLLPMMFMGKGSGQGCIPRGQRHLYTRNAALEIIRSKPHFVDGQLLSLARAGTEGAFKSSQLRSLLDKVGMDGSITNSRAGFGFLHDGRVDTLTRFLADGFPDRAANNQDILFFWITQQRVTAPLRP